MAFGQTLMSLLYRLAANCLASLVFAGVRYIHFDVIAQNDACRHRLPFDLAFWLIPKPRAFINPSASPSRPSRPLLRHVSSCLPQTCAGCLPGRNALILAALQHRRPGLTLPHILNPHLDRAGGMLEGMPMTVRARRAEATIPRMFARRGNSTQPAGLAACDGAVLF